MFRLLVLFLVCLHSQTSLAFGVQSDAKQILKDYETVPISVEISVENAQGVAILNAICQKIDLLFLNQSFSGNLELLSHLQDDTSNEGALSLQAFWLNMGPYDQLNNQRLFLSDDFTAPRVQPLGANLYPEDATREELKYFLDTFSEESGFFSVVRRGPEGRLRLVPYSEEYADILVDVATMLDAAANELKDENLAKFLEARADALMSNNYYDSDVTWVKLSGNLDVIVGPYEPTLDKLFGTRTAFQMGISSRNDRETKQAIKYLPSLEKLAESLLEGHEDVPVMALRERMTVVVADMINEGGLLRRSPQHTSISLPNNDRFIRRTGSKTMVFNNLLQKRFEHVISPIANVVLPDRQRGSVSAEAFLRNMIVFGLSHSIGPEVIVVDGRTTTATAALEELHDLVEVSKAKSAGICLLSLLEQSGVISAEERDASYITFLVSTVEELRMGRNNVDGEASAMIFHYFLDQGAFMFDRERGSFYANVDHMDRAAWTLAREMVAVEVSGNKERAEYLKKSFSQPAVLLQGALRALLHVPIQINPTFTGNVEYQSTEWLHKSDLEDFIHGLLAGAFHAEAQESAACVVSEEFLRDMNVILNKFYKGTLREGMLDLVDALRQVVRGHCGDQLSSEVPQIKDALNPDWSVEVHTTNILRSSRGMVWDQFKSSVFSALRGGNPRVAGNALGALLQAVALA